MLTSLGCGRLILGRLAVLFVALLTACLGIVQPAVAASRMSSVTVTYTYDGPRASTSLTGGIADNGPPAAYDHTAASNAVGFQADVSSARPEDLVSGSTTNYGTPAESAQAVRMTGADQEHVRGVAGLFRLLCRAVWPQKAQRMVAAVQG